MEQRKVVRIWRENDSQVGNIVAFDWIVAGREGTTSIGDAARAFYDEGVRWFTQSENGTQTTIVFRVTTDSDASRHESLEALPLNNGPLVFKERDAAT